MKNVMDRYTIITTSPTTTFLFPIARFMVPPFRQRWQARRPAPDPAALLLDPPVQRAQPATHSTMVTARDGQRAPCPYRGQVSTQGPARPPAAVGQARTSSSARGR